MKMQPEQKKQNILLGTLFVLLAVAAVYVVFQVGMLALEREPVVLTSSYAEEAAVSSAVQPVTSQWLHSTEPEAEAKKKALNDSVSEPAAAKRSVSDTVSEKEDIFQNYYAAALKKMESMTLEEKIGQLFICRCPGAEAVQTVKDYYPGGYMLFWGRF